MEDDRGQASADSTAAVADDAPPVEPAVTTGDEVASSGVTWSSVWQVPAILLSIALIAVGLVVAGRRAPEDDFGAALAEVEELIGVGEFSAARLRLEEVLRPNLLAATRPEKARFHAAAADWISASQDAAGTSVVENNERIVEQYTLARDLGRTLSPVRLERWAHAHIRLGQIREAHKRLAELEALGVMDARADARQRRNRLLRKLVEHSLAQDDVAYEEMSSVLATYRDDPLLSPADQAWVVTHQARLRLEANEAAVAARHLLVDMRRLEDADEPVPAQVWGELYTLLARSYFQQGDYERAAHHLEEAFARLGGTVVQRGEALLLKGQIAVAQERHEDAFEQFDEVIRNYPATDAYAPALLGRAEVQSVLGRHPASLDDYRALIELRKEIATPGIPRRHIAASLADRHDAALTIAELPLALQYVSMAEGLFDAGDVPLDVLVRIANTSRQIADNIMVEAAEAARAAGRRAEEIDPALRHRAIEQYARAAEYSLRHARALTTVPDGDEGWAGSLWLAADNFDLAGRPRQAITHFLEYIAGRPIDDQLRAKVTFRLARAYQANLELDRAAEAYEKVLAEHPRSTYGTQSHLPLARCYRGLDRIGEAEQQLLRVIEGRRGEDTPITPDATDYRQALFELGDLYYDLGDYTRAIERLEFALARYPDAPERVEATFCLADSLRRYAANSADVLVTEPNLAPADRLSAERDVRVSREQAQRLFAGVIAAYSSSDRPPLDRLQQDYLRYATFYQADCVFDLGEYAKAAELYDLAARRYQTHHMSMDALVQIVNCFDRLDNRRAADIAHRNALIRLRQLPDEAFDNPDSIMDRAAWERWLQNRPLGTSDDTRTAQSS
ncbi:MAG: tetratricopeptide repeat protein [Phycisphaerales bacterium]|nr:tetratricopeptide repeat protein [Phycisphaerae bacterium]NNF44745.1 tetratricopeptide repeat protein [Phycisphaerales bacterium]NNM26951.1 tetratricopeptide repeat protein [Phycisphaerales bacterium]